MSNTDTGKTNKINVRRLELLALNVTSNFLFTNFVCFKENSSHSAKSSQLFLNDFLNLVVYSKNVISILTYRKSLQLYLTEHKFYFIVSVTT